MQLFKRNTLNNTTVLVMALGDRLLPPLPPVGYISTLNVLFMYKWMCVTCC